MSCKLNAHNKYNLIFIDQFLLNRTHLLPKETVDIHFSFDFILLPFLPLIQCFLLNTLLHARNGYKSQYIMDNRDGTRE